MNKLIKLFLWLTGIFVVLALTAGYLAPKLINSELLKGRIENVFSQKVGGRVEFQAIDLSIFPRPNLIIRNGSIITETASGTLEALSVYPKILPLLTGKLQVTRILVKSPDITMSLPVDEKKAESEKSVSPEVITNLFAPMALALPDLVVEMEGGKFNFVSEDRPVFFMDDIDFRIVFPPSGLNVTKAEIKSSALELRVQRKDHESVIKASNLKGSLYYDKEKTAIMTPGKINFNMKGDVNTSEDGLIFDFDISTDKIEWDILKEAFSAEKKGSDTGSFFDFPVKGIIRLSSESFTYDKYTFKPVHADISIDPDNITITVTESDLCDISFSGTLQLTPKDMSFAINPAAEGEELRSALSCLLGGEKRMTGKFAFTGKVASQGTKESIADLLYGNLEFSASEGRIYKLNLLSKILAFLNITEIYRGMLPAEVIKEGFAYHSLSVKGDIKESILFIKESRLDGYSMNIFLEGEINLVNKKVDLDVLAAPLKTTDFIVDKVPILRDITGGTIVSIPLKVTGDIENPNITYLSVSAVGSRLLNIMKNTLKTPVKVIEPIISK